MDRTQTVALASGLSLSLWVILLAWLQLFNLRLTQLTVALIFGAGWLIAILKNRPALWSKTGPKGGRDYYRYGFWATLAASALINILLLNHRTVGPGSDSLHHAIIVQLFEGAGGIPDNYLPIAPLATFRYHFGFHALAYAVNVFSGLEAHVITPLLSQLLVPMVGLTTSYLVSSVWKRRSGSFFTAVIISLVAVFPAYLINWGRYSQSAGLMLLPLVLVEFISERHENEPASHFLYSGLLAAGLALTHYRIAIMALAAGLLFLLNDLISINSLKPRVSSILGKYAWMGVVGLLLITPWLWHLYRNWGNGYPPQFIVLETSFFSLSRLGQPVLEYPTNNFLFVLLALAALLAVWRRERPALVLLAWGALLVLLSAAQVGAHYLDLVTVVISLSVPIAALIGWFIGELTGEFALRGRWLVFIPIGATLGMGVWGASLSPLIVHPWNDNVLTEDVQAMAWIEEQLPESALFAINTLEFPFMRGFVAGIDAGYWIPVLAHRGSVTYPLIYSFENLLDPDYVERIHAFAQAQSDLASEPGIRALEALKVTHVYLGKKGGPIDPAPLLASERFQLIYDQDGVMIFQVFTADDESQ